jgi:transposase
VSGLEPGPDAEAGGKAEEEHGGGVDGLAVPGDQDALPVVTLDDASQGRASAGEVLVPRLGAGRVRPIGIGVGRATERGFDLVPDPGGLFVARWRMSWIRRVLVAMILLRPLLSPASRLQNGRVMSMQAVPWPEPDPVVAAAIRAMRGSRKAELPLAVAVRDRLGEWLHDGDFAAAFGTRGRPGWSPSRLALVTVLQRAENLTDRMAAGQVRMRLDWKYLLGLPLDDPGFDHSVLAEFRARVAEAELEQAVLDALLERLAADGLVRAGGKQRTDSTHVVAAVAALNRLELAGESVRAALEAVTAAHPGWAARVLHVSEWARRYATPVTDWHPPASKKQQDDLAVAYAKDGYALLRAVYDKASPAWLAELPAVGILRQVLVQNYALVIHADGREVITRREKEDAEGNGDGLPPGKHRIASPFDTDARRGAKRGEFWLGYKLHVSETCDDIPPCGCPGGQPGHDRNCAAAAFPNLITHVATTDATVTDNAMTPSINDALAAKGLAPERHYLDSGYLSAALVLQEAGRHGIALIGPLLADTSAQARAGNGYARADFTVSYDSKTVTCPQGKTSASWSPCVQNGKDAIVATFSPGDCGPCPARKLCTSNRTKRRQLTVPPRDLAEAQAAARSAEKTRSFQADYARRAGVEGTMHQAASHGARRARYRGLSKTRLDHVFMGVALNLLRLNAYWNGTPLDRSRTSHLARLELSLAA